MNCINCGDNSYWSSYENPTDLKGERRITRRIVDLGCYEFPPLGLMLIVR